MVNTGLLRRAAMSAPVAISLLMLGFAATAAAGRVDGSAAAQLSSTPIVEVQRLSLGHSAAKAEKGNAQAGPDLIFRANFQPFRSLQGVAVTAQRTDTDNDTNDPTAPLIENNGPSEAWELPNPVTVGGYVTGEATGRTGDRFAGGADMIDGYRITLSAGQIVELEVSDHRAGAPTQIDLDLYLYDPNNPASPLASSTSTGSIEAIQAPGSGTFDIVVEAFAGASNYVLRAETVSSAAAQMQAAAAGAEMMPDEVVVGLRPGRGEKFVKRWTAGKNASSGSFTIKRSGGRNTLLLQIDDSKDLQRKAQRFNPLGTQSAVSERDRVAAAIKILAADPDVKFVEPNYRMHAFATVNDPVAPLQWHYGSINLGQAWDVTTGDPSVVTAVIDTGVSPHRDLVNNLTNDGYDLISSPNVSRDGGGPDPDARDPGDLGNPDGSSTFHGTHVAGTVGAVSNNGLDVAGVAYTSRIMPIRVLGRGGGSNFDITQGILYAAGVPNASGALPNQAADVINLSLGGPAGSQAAQDAVNAARAQGTIVIAAAGNDATSAPAFPSAYAGVVSVSATDASNQLAPYSNFGLPIDVAAPGGNVGVDFTGDGYPDGVLSTLFNDRSGTPVQTLDFNQGTSMAAPHVAGVASLMRSVAPNLTPNDFDTLLANGDLTRDLLQDGPGRNNLYGHGLIDAFRAVEAAANFGGGTTVPPVLLVEPSSLTFGSTGNNAELVAANVGSGSLNINSVMWNAPWLQIGNPSTVDNTLVYPVSVDRSGLVAATYNDVIIFETDIPSTVRVPVSLTVGSSEVQFGGKQYLLLVDVDTGETLHQLTGLPNNAGEYRFQFDDIAEDEYYVFIGTDSDNDGFICDEGEACGGFPDISRPEPVELSGGNVTLPTFSTGYSAPVTVSRTTSTRRPALRRLDVTDP